MAMHHFIDRRQNPGGRSLGNRQRFIRRAKAQIKEALDDGELNPVGPAG